MVLEQAGTWPWLPPARGLSTPPFVAVAAGASRWDASSRCRLPVYCARRPAVLHVVFALVRLHPSHRSAHNASFEGRQRRVGLGAW
jgi:hypothetical protein